MVRGDDECRTERIRGHGVSVSPYLELGSTARDTDFQRILVKSRASGGGMANPNPGRSTVSVA